MVALMFRCWSAMPAAYSQIIRPCHVTAMAIDGTPDASRAFTCETTAEKSGTDLVGCACPRTDSNPAGTTKARNAKQIQGIGRARRPRGFMFSIDGSRLRTLAVLVMANGTSNARATEVRNAEVFPSRRQVCGRSRTIPVAYWSSCACRHSTDCSSLRPPMRTIPLTNASARLPGRQPMRVGLESMPPAAPRR
jgi:hypothetical protein